MKGNKIIGEVANILRKEHFEIAQILDMLEREFDKLKQGDDPDYELINLLVEYLATYPDAIHHRKEDLVYRKLRDKLLPQKGEIFDLVAEHEKIDDLVKSLSHVVDQIELDQELPKAKVYQVVRDYIDFLRRHMSMEETSFLPLAELHLKPEDWEEITLSIKSVTHPMFDRQTADRSAALYRQILNYD